MPPLVLIGYFPKKVVQRPDWLKAAGVTAIRSVSSCISPGPPDWINRWAHNALGVYSTIAAAWDVVPRADRPQYEMQAYRMLPVAWDEGAERALTIPTLNLEPLPRDFQSAGFDVVWPSRVMPSTALRTAASVVSWVIRMTVFSISEESLACCTIDSSEMSLSAMRLATAANTPMRSCTVSRMK